MSDVLTKVNDVLVVSEKPCKIKDCPKGLFQYKGELYFLSEYGCNYAYRVSTGEQVCFMKYADDLDKLVYPVSVISSEYNAPKTKPPSPKFKVGDIVWQRDLIQIAPYGSAVLLYEPHEYRVCKVYYRQKGITYKVKQPHAHAKAYTIGEQYLFATKEEAKGESQ